MASGIGQCYGTLAAETGLPNKREIDTYRSERERERERERGRERERERENYMYNQS